MTAPSGTSTGCHGIYASTICPMKNGAVDETALADHFASVTAVDGIVGLLINGHAGENIVLDRDEMRSVVSIARQTASAAHLVAGINAETVEHAVALATDAQAAGADNVMVFPPSSWALGIDQRVVLEHHNAVADAVDLPVYLFQGSVHAGKMAFDADTLSRLLEIDSVVGIKEGSWETAAYEATRRLCRRLRPDVAVMASGDEHLLTCYVLGSEGSLVSIAVVAPELVVKLDRAVRSSDLATAFDAHDKLYNLTRLVYAAPGHLASLRLKTCLRLMGRLNSVETRSPVSALADAEVSALRHALAYAELL